MPPLPPPAAIADLLSRLATLGRDRPASLQSDLDAILAALATAVPRSAIFLLDEASGIFRRRAAHDWPDSLSDLQFVSGDLPLRCLERPGALDAATAGLGDTALETLAGLHDEGGAVIGVVAACRPTGPESRTWVATIAPLVSGLLRLRHLPAEKRALRGLHDTILAHLDDAVIISDVHGILLQWNEGARRLLGFRAEEVLTRGGNFIIPESEMAAARQLRHEVAAGTRASDIPCTRVRRDGRPVRVRLTALPVHDVEGRVVGVAEILRRQADTDASGANGRTKERAMAAPPAPRPPSPPAAGMVGNHPALQQVRRLIQRFAPLEGAVLILGESGTGKELVAQALHHHGPRRLGPWAAINCAAIPEALLESELFGHERGAFTGAAEQKRGILETANGGTVFLDEVAELPLALQAKLLRVLQEKTLRRLGGTEEIQLDVRFVAATNQPLRKRVDEGSFRDDLYYRLNVLTIPVPALRERRQDIAQLVRHGLQRAGSGNGHATRCLTGDALALLCEQPWPGNVRELFNVLERVSALAPDGIIDASALKPCLPDAGVVPILYDDGVRLSLAEVERRHLANVLAEVDGNVTAAAGILGLSRQTVYQKLRRYGLRD